MSYDKKASVGSEAVDRSAKGHAEISTRFRKSPQAHSRRCRRLGMALQGCSYAAAAAPALHSPGAGARFNSRADCPAEPARRVILG
jgi:hypothetical protein